MIHMPEPNRHDDPKQWATCTNCGEPIFRRTWGDWMHEPAFPGGSPGIACRDGRPAVPTDVVQGEVVQREVTDG